jgi:hypothetical protein
MTRRELTQAVIEAAQIAVKEHFARWGMASTAPGTTALKDAARALDACTEPDLDALNAAVGGAVEAYLVVTPSAKNKEFQPPRWVAVIDAAAARRAAMKPRPRYEAANFGSIFDRERQTYLTQTEIVALLNERGEK